MNILEFEDLEIDSLVIVKTSNGWKDIFKVRDKKHDPIPERHDRYYVQCELILSESGKLPEQSYIPWVFYECVKKLTPDRIEKKISSLNSDIGRLQNILNQLK